MNHLLLIFNLDSNRMRPPFANLNARQHCQNSPVSSVSADKKDVTWLCWGQATDIDAAIRGSTKSSLKFRGALLTGTRYQCFSRAMAKSRLLFIIATRTVLFTSSRIRISRPHQFLEATNAKTRRLGLLKACPAGWVLPLVGMERDNHLLHQRVPARLTLGGLGLFIASAQQAEEKVTQRREIFNGSAKKRTQSPNPGVSGSGLVCERTEPQATAHG